MRVQSALAGLHREEGMAKKHEVSRMSRPKSQMGLATNATPYVHEYNVSLFCLARFLILFPRSRQYNNRSRECSQKILAVESYCFLFL
jgi:hypothetical protein